MLILLSEIDGKYTFNLASNIWKQININNKIHLQIITIPSESKIYYNGVNYYTDTINLKKIQHFCDILNDYRYTEDIIKNHGLSIEYLHPLKRTNELCKLAIQNNINSIIYCYMYENLDKELYKNPQFIQKMIQYIPLNMLNKIKNKKRTKNYLMM